MEHHAERVDRLADLLERRLRVFITEPAPVQRRRKRNSFEDLFSTPQQRRLAAMLGEEWDQIAGIADGEISHAEQPSASPRRVSAAQMRRSGGRDEAARLAVGLLETRGRWFFGRFPDELYLGGLGKGSAGSRSYHDRLPDCAAIARRVATHLAAPGAPVEAVVVDLSGHLPRIDLGQGWTLAGFGDPLLPIEISDLERDLEYLHRFRQLAVMVRAERPDAPLHSAGDGRSLSWPLAVLNLALPLPVRAITAYRMIPGGAIIATRTGEYTGGTAFVPAEIARWDPRPDHITPRTLPPLGDDQCRTIAGVARALDEAINRGGLPDWQQAEFWHAVDRLLKVSYHTCDRQLPDGEHEPLPFMDSVEATVHLVAAMEGLFDDEGIQADVTRRLAQRVAVLVSTEDHERPAIRDKVSRHYQARSTRAHGSAKPPKVVDVPDLRDLVRDAILGWAALAPVFGVRQAMAKALDNAILSPATAGSEIAERLRAFRSLHPSAA